MADPHQYRGRFAPSPSGPLHFGSLIAALGSFLDARAVGGEWLIRIEDVDTPRVVNGAADAILRSLDAHGLYWDGAPSYQSQRMAAYRQTLTRLRERALVYPCTCRRREIAEFAARGSSGPVYPGRCRSGPTHPERLAGGRPASLRVVTDDRGVGFDDRLQGYFGQRLRSEVGDFVVRRVDGVFAYQLAVVVDDAEQGVSDVVRGSDLLDSTPRQIYLQSLLGLRTPRYLHLPVAVAGDGAKLSKQTGAPALDDARPLPALLTALRFLGQPLPTGPISTPARLLDAAVAGWDPRRIPARRQIAVAAASP